MLGLKNSAAPKAATVGKIKILHTIGWLTFGGLEGGVIKLVNRLDRNRFSPHVISLRGINQNVRGRLADDVQIYALHKKPGRDWSLVWKFAKYFTHHSIDVVHSHNWDTFLYSHLAARLAGVPVFIHGEHGRDSEEISDSWFKTNVKSFLAWQSNRLTTVSRDIRDIMIKRWRIKPEKIAVTPNGIELDKFHPAADRASLKVSLGFPARSFLVGTVLSYVRPVKDLPTLLKAFAKVKRHAPNSLLAIVGGMENNLEANSHQKDFLEIKRLIESNGISDAVIFAGQQCGVEKYMQAFDLYANSSLYEGMSNTLLEAMGCGAAIVATKVGGTPLIIRDGYNGLLTPSKSPEEMAKAICQLIQCPQLKEKLATNGRKYVETHHNLETFVASHEQIYLEEYLRKGKNLKRIEFIEATSPLQTEKVFLPT
jgi:glycosyltransferase involved in cell wall biosynthesis